MLNSIMIRTGSTIAGGAAVLAAALLLAGCTTSTLAGRPTGIANAGYCLAATQRTPPPRTALRACQAALADVSLPAHDRAATLINRGIIHMHLKNLPAAIADFDAAIGSRPDVAEAYVNKGIALVNMGERDAEAIAVLNEALERNPARPALVYYSRAVANEQLGRARAAYEDYSRAAQLDPAWTEPAQQLQRFRVVRGKTAAG
ncbi:MAG: hypothetical protein DCF31_04940 [Alphaproteobacteria bacterium]|nr:MAG: hypothetical protein DCF31_04940 [Alphaproteobacteria bacterium]